MIGQPEIMYVRALRESDAGLRIGDVFPCWRSGCDLVIATGKHNSVSYRADDADLWLDFAKATEGEFEASMQDALKAIDAVRGEQAALKAELAGFNTTLLTAGEAAPDGAFAGRETALAPVNPVGALRNRAHGLKRRANSLALTVKEKKEFLENKLGQKLAAAMASMADMEGVVERLEEVVMTVQLYLGRDEEVVCLRDGKPSPDGTPLCIRQNVLYMDEECALEQSHGIDYSEIGEFDKWLLSDPAHLAQVIPESKGVVVLQVRRNPKEYGAATAVEALGNALRNRENTKSYWLLRNGERLHRIHADIQVGARLLPKPDEVEHFFFEHKYRGDTGEEQVPLRAGSREYIEAMDRADAVRRHYMRLMLVLQGLIDRTMLFAPFAEGLRPNLLDPESWGGRVHFLRDVDDTITDGRPSFRDWLKKVNFGLAHGHRIVGFFSTYNSPGEKSRVTPRGAEGVNEEDVHTVYERGGRLYFSFKRTDIVWRHDGRSGVAKTPGTYRVAYGDGDFVCIDIASVEDMEYYLKDRRHRHAYEDMVPALQKAVAFKQSEEKVEKPFRDLLQRKLSEATPGNPVVEEHLDRLVFWYKTKNKQHRALLADDAKAYRMILARHKAVSVDRTAAEMDRKAFLAAVARMPDALYAFHAGKGTFGVLRAIEDEPYWVREETWKVSRDAAHCVDAKPYVLAQKNYYRTFASLYESPGWQARQASFSAAKHLSPAYYPALIEFVRSHPWSGREGRKLAAVYLIPSPTGTKVKAAAFEMKPTGNTWRGESREKTILDKISLPHAEEIDVSWEGIRAPKFRCCFTFGTGTFVDSNGRTFLGWSEGRQALFIDQAVMTEVKDMIAKAQAHNTAADRLHRWIRDAQDAASEALDGIWRAKQFAKYSQEGGDPEFFEDHLKTLIKEIPAVDFVGTVLRRAILAGDTPSSLAGQTFAEIAAAHPFQPGKKGKWDEDEKDSPIPEGSLAMLRAVKWTPPAVKDDGRR